jgi:hypothetical protein
MLKGRIAAKVDGGDSWLRGPEGLEMTRKPNLHHEEPAPHVVLGAFRAAAAMFGVDADDLGAVIEAFKIDLVYEFTHRQWYADCASRDGSNNRGIHSELRMAIAHAVADAFAIEVNFRYGRIPSGEGPHPSKAGVVDRFPRSGAQRRRRRG